MVFSETVKSVKPFTASALGHWGKIACAKRNNSSFRVGAKQIMSVVA